MGRRKHIKGLSTTTDVSANINPRIYEKKLGRGSVYGQSYCGTGKIEIDPRQSPKNYLDTLIHEMLHAFFVDLNEKTVIILANKMTKVIWDKDYRRIHK